MSSFLPCLGGDRLRHRNRFEQPEQAIARPLLATRAASDHSMCGNSNDGNLAGISDDFDALLVEPMRDHGRHADDRQQQLGQRMRPAR